MQRTLPAWGLVVALLGSGCGAGHRSLKFIGPEQTVYAPPVGTPLLDVSIETRGVVTPAVPEEMTDEDGRVYWRPVVITDHDVLTIAPRADDPPADLRFSTRGYGLFERHDFTRIVAVTGSIERRFPNEVVFLPETLDRPYRIHVADLANPYNEYRFEHGDLLMVEARAADDTVDRLLLKKRDTGVYSSLFAGVLATIPVNAEASVAPILAIGPTLGWRTRRPAGPLLVLDTVELVVSVGIGSTALDVVVSGLDPSGLFDAGLLGGGVRLFRIVTVQEYVNASYFFRDRPEVATTLAVGVDARGLAIATRDAFARLLRENPVHRP